MRYLIVVVAVLLAACERPKLDQPEIAKAQTVLLAEHDGCSIYYTMSPSTYPNVTWVKCGKDTRAKYSCGKNCTREVTTNN